jgi:glycosyltransferase involved in cell wall biosynthesis
LPKQSESFPLTQGWNNLRLAVVSPFLDRQHGTELCIIEQIEKLAGIDGWGIHLYSQRIAQVQAVQSAEVSTPVTESGIFWHKIPAIPGPHLFKYIWWFIANQILRRWDRRSGKFLPDLTYSPGINCLDADVIVVHIVFREFYRRVKSQLALRRLPVRSWPRVLHRHLYYKLMMFLEQRVYRDPNVRLVAVSHLLAKHLGAHFGRTDVTVIPNAVDTRRFSEAMRLERRPAARQSLGVREDEFVVLLIGNDWNNKGLGTLLKSCAMLPEIPLRVLVVGNDDPLAFRSLASQLSMENRLRFEPPCSDVIKFYAAADLYVGASLEDSFGLPVLEAMACGLPVIASAHAGVSEIIRPGETGLILHEPQNHATLADLIAQIYFNAPTRSKMGIAAAQYAAANCGWHENVRQTREFLENVLLNRTPRAPAS